jgi:hypothetical protein
MKVAVGFFGITRSLKHTIASIRENIFDQLQQNNIEYDIYIHTYHLTNYRNTRTCENVSDKDIDNEEYKLLQANYIEIDNQEDIKKQIDLLLYRTHEDPWNTKYNSVDNFILAQYSKSRLTTMIEKIQFNYDYILFMRPDCLYIKKLPVESFSIINDTTIIIPRFHLCGKWSFNDRFCISNINTYKIYGKIFDLLLDISKKKSLHSESILGEIMADNKLKVIKIPFYFSRVRFNGICVDRFNC